MPATGSGASAREQSTSAAATQRVLVDGYCVTCHNERLRTGGLALDLLDLSRVGDAPEIWEQVVLKLRGGMMPPAGRPAGRPRPDPRTYDGFRKWLEGELDRAAAASNEPGRVPTHRLNRAEYANAVRDLLALEVDAAALLPADDTGHGFDNLAGTLALSPVLMERYLSAARRISRLAVGDPTIGPGFTSQVYGIPITMTQNDRMSEHLPFGSRAGLAVRHHFPLYGEYLVTIRLKRSVYEYIVNLDEVHDLDLRIDGRRVARFTVGGAAPGKPAPVTFSGTFVAAGESEFPSQDWDDYRTGADADLTVRVPVRDGTRVVGVSFVGKSWEQEGVLPPPLREYGATVTETTDTSPRPEGPGVESVAIDGPYAASGPGETASGASHQNLWVDGLEFAPRIVDLHVPVDTALGVVDVGGPRSHFAVQRRQVPDATPVQALARHGAELILRDVQPAAVFRRVAELDATNQLPGPGRLEHFVDRHPPPPPGPGADEVARWSSSTNAPSGVRRVPTPRRTSVCSTPFGGRSPTPTRCRPRSSASTPRVPARNARAGASWRSSCRSSTTCVWTARFVKAGGTGTTC